MDGRIMAAFALTEPGSGSDAMNIRTTAVLNDRGTHYVVNGAKQWITNAGWADLFILFAKVDGTKFTAFLLERETPGLTVGPHERLLGLHGSSVCALTLDDVAIPVENVLGEIGKGHRVALCTLNLGPHEDGRQLRGDLQEGAGHRGRVRRGAAAVRPADRQLRVDPGQAVRDGGAGLRRRVGRLPHRGPRLHRARGARRRTARDSLDAKLATLAEFSAECAMAKVFGTETYHGLADEALQIFGGNGFSEDYPVARMYRDSRITRIYEGTSEICRLSIGKAILKRLDRGIARASAADPARSGSRLPAGIDPDPRGGAPRPRWPACGPSVSTCSRRRWGGSAPTGCSTTSGRPISAASRPWRSSSTAPSRPRFASRKLEQSRPGGRHLARHGAGPAHARASGGARSPVQAAAMLGGLHAGEDLREALAAVDRRLPLPADRAALDGEIARALIEREGALPDFAAA